MKTKIILLCPLIFALLLPLHAQESASEDSAGKDEKLLPEVSDPPYTVGDRATIQGQYVPLEDGISINFRIRNNRIYIYWVDADDLIVEPQATAGNVRFIADVRGRSYFTLEPLGNEDGLGSVGAPVYEPHIFTVILSLEKTDGEGFNTYTFRYTSVLAAKRESRVFFNDEKDSSESTNPKDKGY